MVSGRMENLQVGIPLPGSFASDLEENMGVTASSVSLEGKGETRLTRTLR